MPPATPLGRPISVRLPDELRERVAVIAVATRRSQGDVVREVLERNLAHLEWELRIGQEAADLRSGRLASVPFEKVEAELGLSDEPVPADALDDVE